MKGVWLIIVFPGVPYELWLNGFDNFEYLLSATEKVMTISF